MYEHTDLVHSSFPSEGANQTRLAGDVINFPVSSQQADKNRMRGEDNQVKPFNPTGDMTGGGKVVPGPGYTK